MRTSHIHNAFVTQHIAQHTTRTSHNTHITQPNTTRTSHNHTHHTTTHITQPHTSHTSHNHTHHTTTHTHNLTQPHTSYDNHTHIQPSQTADLVNADASEEEKVRAMIKQSGEGFDPSQYAMG